MTGLPDKIVAIHRALGAGGIPHAFGGALALAWCTRRARGTVDIDVNLFVDPARAAEALDALPDEVVWTAHDLDLVERDGQARLWWEATPVDVFLSTTEFHEQVANRCRNEWFADAELPFLACDDLAVFKAFFDRSRDWADLEEMIEARMLDADRVIGVLVRYLGPDDDRVSRLRALAG